MAGAQVRQEQAEDKTAARPVHMATTTEGDISSPDLRDAVEQAIRPVAEFFDMLSVQNGHTTPEQIGVIGDALARDLWRELQNLGLLK